jgi:hypothetical protein
MPGSRRKWPIVAGVIFIAGFIVAMVWSTSTTAQYHCEVCMAFNGRTVCRNGAASTKQEAQRIGTDLACSDLGAGGFSPCARLDPVSVKWR